MTRVLTFFALLIVLQTNAQDTTMNSLTKGMDNPEGQGKKAVKVFDSDKLINANTTEVVGKGKMEFKVTHNFDDIAGDNGGIKKFFGLDNSTDIRIGFHIGVTDRLTIAAARSKGGAGVFPKTYVAQLYELSLKYQLMKQIENDPSHPFAVTLFASNVIAANNSDYTAPKDLNPLSPRFGLSNDTILNQSYTFQNLGDRMSQVLQAIIAKKTGRMSLLMNFTLVHQGYVPLHDQNTIFSIGGAVRLPLTRNMNLILDYFHSFRSKESKNYFKTIDNSFNPPNDIDKNTKAFKFYDPLGIGFEIITAGHIFHLNFTNAIEIPETRFITHTTRSWGKGEFRWGFTISRTFVLWRQK